MKKLYLLLAYILPYFSLLLIEFLYTIMYEDGIEKFFEIQKFTDPIIPAVLATLLTVFLGKFTNYKK
ncbi:hypothetical protein [[Mannheimia] succiniciproducens]|uniref:hypothetical protein n=1 Tax=[Mannheimia] succiniciproducens TaxID=157673 RepID=UPI0005A1C40A|nr:hypothetical protein [[Mannheimia] succiniciproducens]